MLAQQIMHSFEWLPLHHCCKIELHSFLLGMTVRVRGFVQDPFAKEKKTIRPVLSLQAQSVPNNYIWPVRDHVSNHPRGEEPGPGRTAAPLPLMTVWQPLRVH